MSDFIAHGPDHGLVEHLESVARLADGFAPASGGRWAHLAGLWHDLGKFRPGFQHYIRQDENAHIEGKSVRLSLKTHSAAGALHACEALEAEFGETGRRAGWLLAHLIAAHHAGLYDDQDLRERLHGANGEASRTEYEEARKACRTEHSELLGIPQDLPISKLLPSIPGLLQRECLAQSLWLRMLFSGLVDADFLDTEAYLDSKRAEHRTGFPSISEYLLQLDEHLDQLMERVRASGRSDDPVMRARAQVLADCRLAAQWPTGVFSLQVPTGGGKTLASLAFALRHAATHGLERVIVAIPYTSIVEQTADVLAAIFGREHVVEHHSQADSDSDKETARSRLACENWDAPLIVTTNVQLFESLFAARTSRCRKLHRIQRSVIVLDEAQTLPPPFLQPTLDALRLLTRCYGASIVSCTATQPVLTDIKRFDPRRDLRGLTVDGAAPREIVQAVEPLYAQLERIRLHWPADLHSPAETAALADRLVSEPSVLAIVNTRADAAELVLAVDSATSDGETTLHLSAAMCGQHRADVIAEIRERLDLRRAGDKRTLRVIATQLVEAGVDIDFPVVFRALAGLDSIAQAAGRCNREGRLGPGGGRVEIFVRPIPAVLTTLMRAVQATRSVLGTERPDSLGPSLFRSYFQYWYGQFNLDQHGIGNMLRNRPDFDLEFRSAAKAYKLIDDQAQMAVVVPYVPTAGSDARVEQAMRALESGTAERWHLRVLQRFVVQAREREARAWLADGDVVETIPGWFLLRNEARYDNRFGLLNRGSSYSASGLVA